MSWTLSITIGTTSQREKGLQAPCLLIGQFVEACTKPNSSLFLDGIILNLLP
jgi:hypothetical protein